MNYLGGHIRQAAHRAPSHARAVGDGVGFAPKNFRSRFAHLAGLAWRRASLPATYSSSTSRAILTRTGTIAPTQLAASVRFLASRAASPGSPGFPRIEMTLPSSNMRRRPNSRALRNFSRSFLGSTARKAAANSAITNPHGLISGSSAVTDSAGKRNPHRERPRSRSSCIHYLQNCNRSAANKLTFRPIYRCRSGSFTHTAACHLGPRHLDEPYASSEAA